MAGMRDKVKGSIKEATGILIADKALEREGKVDKVVGEVKETVGKVVDKVRAAITPTKDSASRRAKKAAKSLR